MSISYCTTSFIHHFIIDLQVDGWTLCWDCADFNSCIGWTGTCTPWRILFQCKMQLFFFQLVGPFYPPVGTQVTCDKLWSCLLLILLLHSLALAPVWSDCHATNNNDDFKSILIFTNLSYKRFGPARFNCLYTFSSAFRACLHLFRCADASLYEGVAIRLFVCPHIRP